MTDDRRVLRDRELVSLLADEPELLAILDAYATTQQRSRRIFPPRGRRLAALLAATVAIAVPAVAFANEIGEVLGLSNPGSPIASDQLPGWQLPALGAINFPTQGIRLLGSQDGVSFYVGTKTNGSYCLGIGFASPSTPRIDALDCGDQLEGFPSVVSPIADFSSVSVGSDDTMRVNLLVGFAVDDVAQIELLSSNGAVLYATPVSDNIYAAYPPQVAATRIAAVNSNGTVLYTKSLGATRPVPPPPVATSGSDSGTEPGRTPSP